MDETPTRPPLRVFSIADARAIPPHPRRGTRPVEMDRTPVRVRGEPLRDVWWRGRQWAVTAYGLERLDGTYPIKANRLAENIDRFGWPEHMSRKVWCDPEDFGTAWLVAVALHGTRVKGGKRMIREALGRARIAAEDGEEADRGTPPR